MGPFLNKICENWFLCYERFGFRLIHSCLQQVLRLVKHITEDFKSKQETVVVSFDIAKAFDRVWHASLIYKLHALEVPDRLIHIINSYIRNRCPTRVIRRRYRDVLSCKAQKNNSTSPALMNLIDGSVPGGWRLTLISEPLYDLNIASLGEEKLWT
ncbi:Probable RNA-directed DNA polymerase from transposon BS [Eumeta japonica]|uniref:Probable RNA-directed DNA polymerase from transposon BS n=1 Tax=Eumeta variegata TaxID=151549 RepID=A0A4C1X7L9_EUMVA|nr:Probable RNA-directed DNA polymerase from transposon BS [Eumeta japonica]